MDSDITREFEKLIYGEPQTGRILLKEESEKYKLIKIEL